MILNSQRGVTLIELIIFIIVGGIFIPLAYIVFTSVVKDSAKPEISATIQTIVQAKIEDIRNADFTTPPSECTNYQDVQSDVNNRFNDPSYAGFQWKWNYEYIAYQDSDNRRTTTIKKMATVPSWSMIRRPLGNQFVYVGDYILETDNVGNNHFYRAQFLKWLPSTLYQNDIYVVPTVQRYNIPFRASKGGTSAPDIDDEPDNWENADSGTDEYKDGGIVWEIISTPSSPSTWHESTEYHVNDEIIVESTYYRASNTGTSGTSEPSPWENDKYDGLLWKATPVLPTLSLQKGSAPPASGLSVAASEVNDNQIRWEKSNVYRLFTVSVRSPSCRSAECEYIFPVLMTSRAAP